MNKASEYAKERAYGEFVSKLNSIGGFQDTVTQLQPFEKCRYGAGHLIVPVTGIRNGNETVQTITKAGYDHKYENDPVSDSLGISVIIPFVEIRREEQRRPVRRIQKLGRWKISPTYLIMALILLITFGVTQTPQTTLNRIFEWQ